MGCPSESPVEKRRVAFNKIAEMQKRQRLIERMVFRGKIRPEDAERLKCEPQAILKDVMWSEGERELYLEFYQTFFPDLIPEALPVSPGAAKENTSPAHAVPFRRLSQPTTGDMDSGMVTPKHRHGSVPSIRSPVTPQPFPALSPTQTPPQPNTATSSSSSPDQTATPHNQLEGSPRPFPAHTGAHHHLSPAQHAIANQEGMLIPQNQNAVRALAAYQKSYRTNSSSPSTNNTTSSDPSHQKSLVGALKQATPLSCFLLRCVGGAGRGLADERVPAGAGLPSVPSGAQSPTPHIAHPAQSAHNSAHHTNTPL